MRAILRFPHALMVYLGLTTLLRCGAIITVDIFNSVNPSIDVVYNVDESTDFGDVVVPSEEVERAVRELVANKSCGIDGIYAEHMLYSSHVCFVCSASVCLAFWFMVSCLMR